MRILYRLALLAIFACQGCMAAAVYYGAKTIGESKIEAAEKTQRSADLATYARYRTEMERLNFDREKAGFKPRPIMTQEEWISAQTAGRPPITPEKPTPQPPDLKEKE